MYANAPNWYAAAEKFVPNQFGTTNPRAFARAFDKTAPGNFSLSW